MKRSYALALATIPFVLGGCVHPHLVGEARSRLDQEVVQAVASLKAAFPQLEDKLREAPGYAVFPEISKGGFVLGGAHGIGEFFEDGQFVGFCDIAQGTFGAQIGGQIYRQLVVFTSRDALSRWTLPRLVLAMQVSGVGGDAGVALAHPYDNGVEIYVQPIVGLMGEAAIGGQRFLFLREAVLR